MKTLIILLFAAVTIQAQYVALSWDGGDPDSAGFYGGKWHDGDTVTYNVAFSKDSTFNVSVYHAETQAPWNVTRLTVPSPPVEPLTTYYWYVTATDNHGATSVGYTWKFSTSGFDPNEPPPYLIVKQILYDSTKAR